MRLLGDNEVTMQLQIPAPGPSAFVTIRDPRGGFFINESILQWPRNQFPLNVKFTMDNGESFTSCWPWNITLNFGDFAITEVSNDSSF